MLAAMGPVLGSAVERWPGTEACVPAVASLRSTSIWLRTSSLILLFQMTYMMHTSLSALNSTADTRNNRSMMNSIMTADYHYDVPAHDKLSVCKASLIFS